MNLAYGDLARLQAVVDAGGVAAVVAAMGRHPADAEVLRRGCGALQNLAYGDVARMQAVVDAGGVAAVRAAMRRHARDAKVQRWGRGTLRNLAYGQGKGCYLLQSLAQRDAA